MADIRQFDSKYVDVYTQMVDFIEAGIRANMENHKVDAPIPVSMRVPASKCAATIAEIFYEVFADAAVIEEEVKDADDQNG